MKLKALVTGCGGDIGQSVGKILKSNPDFELVVGCDITDRHAGIFIFDKFIKSEPVKSEGYFDRLKTIVDLHDIDVIIPCSEPELRFFSDENIVHTLWGRKLITADAHSMSIGFDKYKTVQFLVANGLEAPFTELISETLYNTFPMIVKSRGGAGGKSIFVAEDADDLAFYRKKYPDFIVQQSVGDIGNEYTCGLYRSSKGEIREIIFRRQLVGGFSNYGEVCNNDSIKTLLHAMAELLNLVGSINVQLRLMNERAYVFEINPRFSSTVMFRHMLGFQDVVWSIADSFNLELPAYKAPMANTKFYKGYTEYIGSAE